MKEGINFLVGGWAVEATLSLVQDNQLKSPLAIPT